MRFRLVRYFTFASLGMFIVVTIALVFFERQQAAFFQEVQSAESEFVKRVQASFARQQEEAARHDLLAIHERANMDLTRLFANMLWERDFAPFVAKVQAIPVEHCRAIADITGEDGKKRQPDSKKACYQELGAKIRALAEYKALDAKVFSTMKKSSVFKVKVFDMRGITAYSSEAAQVGDDKSGNAGWKNAMEGKPVSELTHRDKFSAFEGVVENRDLISSYLPVNAQDGEKVIGVFEVYTDVTGFLDQIKQTSAKIATTARDNENQMVNVAEYNLDEVNKMSNNGIAIVAGLLLLLFASLFAIVRRAEKTIRQQELDREHAHQQLAQAEKMALLGQMVAGVAHQLNTPLAFSRSNISMVIDGLKSFELPLKVAHAFARAVRKTEGDRVTLNISRSRGQLQQIESHDDDVLMLSQMLGDTLQGLEQMRELVENLRDFTRLDREKVTHFDINKGLHTVVYIAKSVIPHRIEVVEEYNDVPEVECNPSQLNQVFLNLINNAAQAIPDNGKITVRTSVEDLRVRIDIIDTGSGIPADVQPNIFDTYFTTKPPGEGTGLGLPIVKNIVEEHGGTVTFTTQAGTGTTFTVYLPAAFPETLLEAA
ncbi:sensor histidine kinase [Noviherbaspirillum sp. ST9]|uniref:sensor histidine kinase n=1 Tax=Noviherbaspirillum sp. ST9 TaxID=3401606 RepID=UPI003B58B0C5